MLIPKDNQHADHFFNFMFKIITIPFDSDTKTFHEDVLNKSILNKKIKSYQVNFFQPVGWVELAKPNKRFR